TEIASGGTVTLFSTTTLKAIAYTDEPAESIIASAFFFTESSLTVNLEPQGAVDAGARWRLEGPVLLNFDDDLWGAYELLTTNPGWSFTTGSAASAPFSLRTPVLSHNQSAGLLITVESSGGDLRFQR